MTEESRAGRGQRHQFWGEIRGGSAGNVHGEAAPREGHGQDIAPGRGNQPGEDKTALKRSQGTKPLSWAVLPPSLHGGRSGGAGAATQGLPSLGTPQRQHPRDPIPSSRQPNISVPASLLSLYCWDINFHIILSRSSFFLPPKD